MPTDPHPVTDGTALTLTNSVSKELFFGWICGLVYGFTSPLVGHPINTIQTIQQTQRSVSSNPFAVARTLYAEGGVARFYKGFWPPALGSIAFRSLMFSSYAGAYTWLGNSSLTLPHRHVPGTLTEWRVPMAGAVAGTVRAVIETPLEYIKVRRQTQQAWFARELYRGFAVTWMRNVGVVTSFMVLVDLASRALAPLMEHPAAASAIKGGACATAAWWIVWPFESMKSQIQAAPKQGPLRVGPRLAWVLRTQGARGLYVGLAAGTLRSLLANGASMTAFTYCQFARDRYIEHAGETTGTAEEGKVEEARGAK